MQLSGGMMQVASMRGYLKDVVGMSSIQLAAVVDYWHEQKDKSMLVPSLRMCKLVVEFLTGDEMGLTLDDAREIIFRFPYILGHSQKMLSDNLRCLRSLLPAPLRGTSVLDPPISYTASMIQPPPLSPAHASLNGSQHSNHLASSPQRQFHERGLVQSSYLTGEPHTSRLELRLEQMTRSAAAAAAREQRQILEMQEHERASQAARDEVSALNSEVQRLYRMASQTEEERVHATFDSFDKSFEEILRLQKEVDHWKSIASRFVVPQATMGVVHQQVFDNIPNAESWHSDSHVSASTSHDVGNGTRLQATRTQDNTRYGDGVITLSGASLGNVVYVNGDKEAEFLTEREEFLADIAALRELENRQAVEIDLLQSKVAVEWKEVNAELAQVERAKTQEHLAQQQVERMKTQERLARQEVRTYQNSLGLAQLQQKTSTMMKERGCYKSDEVSREDAQDQICTLKFELEVIERQSLNEIYQIKLAAQDEASAMECAQMQVSDYCAELLEQEVKAWEESKRSMVVAHEKALSSKADVIDHLERTAWEAIESKVAVAQAAQEQIRALEVELEQEHLFSESCALARTREEACKLRSELDNFQLDTFEDALCSKQAIGATFVLPNAHPDHLERMSYFEKLAMEASSRWQGLDEVRHGAIECEEDQIAKIHEALIKLRDVELKHLEIVATKIEESQNDEALADVSGLTTKLHEQEVKVMKYAEQSEEAKQDQKETGHMEDEAMERKASLAEFAENQVVELHERLKQLQGFGSDCSRKEVGQTLPNDDIYELKIELDQRLKQLQENDVERLRLLLLNIIDEKEAGETFACELVSELKVELKKLQARCASYGELRAQKDSLEHMANEARKQEETLAESAHEEITELHRLLKQIQNIDLDRLELHCTKATSAVENELLETRSVTEHYEQLVHRQAGELSCCQDEVAHVSAELQDQQTAVADLRVLNEEVNQQQAAAVSDEVLETRQMPSEAIAPMETELRSLHLKAVVAAELAESREQHSLEEIQSLQAELAAKQNNSRASETRTLNDLRSHAKEGLTRAFNNKKLHDSLHYRIGIEDLHMPVLAKSGGKWALEKIVTPAKFTDAAKQLRFQGISVKQLLRLCINKEIDGDTTTNEVVNRIVMPETADREACYMRSDFMIEHGGPRIATKLVSHAWSSPFLSVVLNIVVDASNLSSFRLAKLVDEHAKGMQSSANLSRRVTDSRAHAESEVHALWPLTKRKMEGLVEVLGALDAAVLEKTYWLCALGVNQHKTVSDHEIDKYGEVGVMMSRGIMMSLDLQLSSSACMQVLAEIAQAMQTTIVHFKVGCGLSQEFVGKLSEILAEQENHRKRGRNFSPGEEHALIPPLNECKCTFEKEKLTEDVLIERIERNIGLQAFNEFAWCLIDLSFGMSWRLQCSHMPNKTLHALARIQDLEMDFTWLSGVRFSGLGDLGLGNHSLSNLTGLVKLSANFEGIKSTSCASGVPGLQNLLEDCKDLPRLRYLDINLARTNIISDVMLAEGIGELSSLEALSIDVEDCVKLQSVANLARASHRISTLGATYVNAKGTNILEAEIANRFKGSFSYVASAGAMAEVAPAGAMAETQASVVCPEALAPLAKNDVENLSTSLAVAVRLLQWRNRIKRGRHARIGVLSKGIHDLSEERHLACHKKETRPDKDTQKIILKAMQKDKFCASLEEKDLESILQTMRLFEFKPTEFIVKQGDIGNTFFVTNSGELEVRMHGKVVDSLEAGTSFGGHALLHLCPRTASIVSISDSSVWGACGDIFRRMLADRAKACYDKNRKFLDSIRLFDGLPAKQKDCVAEYCFSENFESGAIVVAAGVASTAMYIVKEGELEVAGTGENGGQRTEGIVKTRLVTGDSFGERGLLYDEPQSSTIRTTSHCELLCIAGDTLREVLGSDLCGYLERNLILSSMKNTQQAPLFSCFTSIQQSKITDLMTIHSYSANAPIDMLFDFAVVLDGNVESGSVPFSRGTCFEDISGQGDVATCVAGKRGARVALLLTNDFSKALKELGISDTGNIEETIDYTRKAAVALEIPIFRALSTETLNNLIKVFQSRLYVENEMIIEQGQIAPFLFVVASGEARVSDARICFSDEKVFQKTDLLGEHALFFDEPWPQPATVRVSTATAELWSVSRSVFLDIVKGKMLDDLLMRIRLQDKNVCMEDLDPIKTAGKGAFGVVTLVEHKTTKMKYALKEVQKIEVAQERILLEEIDHPFVVKLVTSFEPRDCEKVSFLMEFIPGGELSLILDRSLSSSQAQFYIGSLVLVLEELLAHSIVYRDMKPENVMLDAQGYLKVIDFGIAKKLEERMPKTFTIIGTPHYMAPEIMRGRGYGTEVDIWSLGVMLYELVCGSLPFANELEDTSEVFSAVLEEMLQFPEDYKDKCGRDLMLKMLSKQPKRRIGAGIRGFEALKSHEFFQVGHEGGCLYDKIMGRQLTAPHIPAIVTRTDMEASVDAAHRITIGRKWCIVTADVGIDVQTVMAAKPFRNWVEAISKESRVEVSSIRFQSVDMFGKNVGFIKFIADAKVDGKSVPGVVFMRGGAVAILVILYCESREYTLVVRQPRVSVCSNSFVEILTGMLDGDGNFAGVAAKKLKEETGIEISEGDLIDMTPEAYQDKYPGMFPTCGASDEFNRMYLYQKVVSAEELASLDGKLIEGEMIKLQIVPLTALWRRSADAKALVALCLYRKLQEVGSIPKVQSRGQGKSGPRTVQFAEQASFREIATVQAPEAAPSEGLERRRQAAKEREKQVALDLEQRQHDELDLAQGRTKENQKSAGLLLPSGTGHPLKPTQKLTELLAQKEQEMEIKRKLEEETKQAGGRRESWRTGDEASKNSIRASSGGVEDEDDDYDVVEDLTACDYDDAEEKRLAEDGNRYTKAEFMVFFDSEDGETKWATAPKETGRNEDQDDIPMF